MEKDKNDELFDRRVIELARRAERGVIAVGDFLSPREIHAAAVILDGEGARGRYAFYGGFDNAERRRLFCLPEYMTDAFGGAESAAVDAAADEISTLRVDGSGYRTLTHRDFMGAILALGIKRAVLGDIIVDGDGHGAYIFCDGKIAAFIAENLTRIGADAVRARAAELPEGFTVVRRAEPITDTVASMRADCVVAALVNCAREHAKSLVLSGLVEVNYETWSKPDAELESGDIVSVRGEGKFRIIDTDGVTRRGRLRLSAEKFI